MSLTIVKLSQVLKLEYGKALPDSDRDIEGAYSAYGANGEKAKTNKFLYDKPSIIVGRKGSAGELTLTKDKFWALDVTYYVTHDERESDLMYLYYALQTKNLTSLARGVKPGINRNDVYELEIPLPSLATQQKIVEKLDTIFAEIDKAIAATEANVKNAEALFQSYLTEVFERGGEGWVKNKLSTICTKIGSGATPRGGNESYKSEGISLIRSMNVYDDGFLYDSLAHIDEEQARALDNVTVESHDVLFNITGASVARCCVVPIDVLPARVNQHVSILRAIKEKINPNLLHLLLISKLHKNNLLKVGESGGTTRQAITKSQLIDYEISYPQELKSQKELVQSIQEFKSVTNSLRSASVDKLNSFHPMKKSILKQAFNGELVKEER